MAEPSHVSQQNRPSSEFNELDKPGALRSQIICSVAELRGLPASRSAVRASSPTTTMNAAAAAIIDPLSLARGPAASGAVTKLAVFNQVIVGHLMLRLHGRYVRR